MNKRRNNKRSLGMSLLCLLLCTTMLVGATFAWFTDTASTTVSTIQAGTLDIDLLDANQNSLDQKPIGFVNAATGEVLTDVLWEPGAKFRLQPITLVNNGTLAAKCKVIITAANGTGGQFNLADVIDVIVEGKTVGTLSQTIAKGDEMDSEFNLLPGESEDYGTVELMMQTTAGNDYQGLTLNSIAVTVLATQATQEHDSYNSSYDASAQFPDGEMGGVNATVGTAADLKGLLEAAFQNNQSNNYTVKLTSNIDAANAWTTFAVPSTGSNITIDGNGYTISNLNMPLVTGLWGGSGTLTFKNLTISNANITGYDAQNVGGSLSAAGIFMAYADAATGVIFENCHVTGDSVINSNAEYVGGLLGYASAPVTITNCSVSGLTVTGGKSVGGIIGQDADAGTMNQIRVTNSKISSTGVDAGKKYCGTIVGTSNAKASVYSGVATSGNTINGAASEAYYGRAYVGLTINGAEQPLS